MIDSEAVWSVAVAVTVAWARGDSRASRGSQAAPRTFPASVWAQRCAHHLG